MNLLQLVKATADKVLKPKPQTPAIPQETRARIQGILNQDLAAYRPQPQPNPAPRFSNLQEEYNSYTNHQPSAGNFLSKLVSDWRNRPANQLWNRSAGPILGSLSKSFLYDPENKRLFPSSPLYPENSYVTPINDMLKQYGSLENIPPEEKKKMIDIAVERSLPLIMGTTGNLTPSSGFRQSVRRAVQENFELARVRLRNILASKPEVVKKTTVSPATELSDDVIAGFKTWVNKRRTSELSGTQVNQAFKDLDQQGMSVIDEIQSGAAKGAILDDLRSFFDKKHAQLKASGIDLGYKKDYLPQLWKDPKEKVQEVLSKTITRNPSFSFSSVIDSYKSGIEGGLTPRFTKVSDLAGWYQSSVQKTLADREFFQMLEKKGLIVPESAAPKGWQTIKAEGFPVNKVITEGGGEALEHYSTFPKLAEAIDNYMTNPSGPLSKFANFVTQVKNLGLSAGVPKTSLNAHGLNLYSRNILSAKNPLTTAWRTTRWWFKPESAQTWVRQNLDKARFYSNHGLTLTTEDAAFSRPIEAIKGNLFQKSKAHLINIFNDWFETPLFKQTVTAVKVNYVDQLYDDLVKSGMGSDEAASLAAKTGNNVFGGQNLDELMRNKDTQNLLRSLFLAPDWYESAVNIAKGTTQGLLHPRSAQGMAYRTFARNFFFSYLTLNLTNKLLSGHWMFQNDGTNRKFQLDLGSYTADGQKRYLQPYGTSVDMIRIPYEVAAGLLSGNTGAVVRPIANRLSMPAGSALHLMANVDYLGRPIYGSDRYGNPIPIKTQAGGIANELLSGLGVPSQARAGIDLVTGKSNAEQFFAQLTEAPLKYSNPTNTKKEKSKLALMQSAGLSGQEIYKKMTEPSVGPDPLSQAIKKESDQSKRLERIREIYSLGLDTSKTEALLQKENINPLEAKMEMVKTLGIENGSRPEIIQSMLKGLTGEEYLQTVAELMKAKVLTSGVISYFEDNGILDKNQADRLKAMLKQLKPSSKSSGTGSKRIKPLTPRKISVSIPRLPASKPIAVPTIKPISSYKPIETRLKPLQLPTL